MKFKKLVKWSICAALATGPAGIARAGPANSDAAAIDWIRAKAQTFADTAPTFAELTPLVAQLAKARVIGIGEVTHGDHQDQTFKAELIKTLIIDGKIDTLALECSRQAGADFDNFARTGNGDLTALIRSKQFFRTWQDDEMAGLILWIRAWNAATTNPIRIVGIDNQDANHDIAHALEFIEAGAPPLAARLSEGVSPMLDEKGQTLGFYKWVVATPQVQFDKATAGVRAIISAFQAHKEAWASEPGYDEAEYAAEVAAQGLREFDQEAGNPDIDIDKLPAEYGNRRDVYMATNLIRLSRGAHRVALWAHDVHVISDMSEATKSTGWLTTGTELRRQIGSEYVSIGFAWTEGSFNSRAVSAFTDTAIGDTEWTPQTLPNNRPQDLGGVLAKAALPRFWIDLHSMPAALADWANTPRFRGWAGAIVRPRTWQSNDEIKSALTPSFDYLVYFRTITPSHMWKKLPAPKP